MNKSEKFEQDLKEVARFARVISHPARLAILKYLAETQTCISGDISDNLPLSRTTVSQHLKELKEMGLIQGTVEGLKINYCLCYPSIDNQLAKLKEFFEPIKTAGMNCPADDKIQDNKILTNN
jgi:ArsR family transcriptional regulator, arsenate/arsenite/antimonite-responsive transcriptional repressor